MEMTDPDSYLKDRQGELKKAKEKGAKVVGYLPGNYVPEEIIYASGAIPMGLIHGGDYETADASFMQLPPVMCAFSRYQVGERLLGGNPYYLLPDMLVAPITCQHIKKMAEIWEKNGDLEIYKLGVPHQYDTDFSLKYFLERLNVLKSRLKAVTGNEVTDDKLRDAVVLYNGIRKLLRNISLLRRDYTPFSSLDFLKLNHVSFYADPNHTVEMLQAFYDKARTIKKDTESNKPRLMLVGPNIALGDYKLFEMIDRAGGEIVIEEIFEGVRYYWQDINTNDEITQSLASGYLRDRPPSTFMRHSAKKRLDFVLNLIKEFNVTGVIWYELLGCETFDSESYFFSIRLREHNIPMLILESDYNTSDLGQMRVRIEAFIEQIRGI